MSGKLISTGLITNNGSKSLNIEFYLNKKIKDLTIHVMPLFINNAFKHFTQVTGTLKLMIPMLINPSLTHVAIQINLEETKDILIFEYGQYLTEDSDFNETFLGSSNSSEEPRRNFNNNNYYINKDGARITIIRDHINNPSLNEDNLSEYISDLIACQYYHIPLNEFVIKRSIPYNTIIFHKVDCNIENKINIKELIENFQGEKWLAKDYNLVFHNCQDFAVEVIKILKAVRKNEFDKIRTFEKNTLPGCIANQLWRNEKLSIRNTLGRIPIFGLFYDFVTTLILDSKK